MNDAQSPIASPFDARLQAKSLLRIARTGALATLDRASGAPLTTLVAVASDYDGSPLFLLSTLSQHTKNLAADPRGSLLLTGPPGRGDPLNQPRLTVGGEIVAQLEPKARARFLARNPKAKLYASFADFSLFRAEISSVHFNGGFGRAAALTPAEILTDLTGAGDLIEAEADLLAEVNAREPAHLATWRAMNEATTGDDGAPSASIPTASTLPRARMPPARVLRRRQRPRRHGAMRSMRLLESRRRVRAQACSEH